MNKKLICTAVGGALALGAGSSQAWLATPAFDALVPYVVKDANRTTVVTVIMQGDFDGTVTNSVGDLHLQYWTKSTTDANTAACQPNSVQIPVTQNDIVTFDTAGLLGYPLFGDSTNPAPLGVGISYSAPRHGYLMVQSPFSASPDNDLTLNNSYWIELDLANGGAHGDQARLNHLLNLDLFYLSSGYMELFPSWWNGTAVNFFPSSVASTVFTVTPLGTNMVTKENNQVVVQVFNNGVYSPVQGAYDRNENGVDGTVPVTVRCVGRVTPAQLMPGVVANVAWAKQGGWGNLVNLGTSGNCYDTNGCTSNDFPAVIYQVDTSSAGGRFISNATRITSANGTVAPSDRRLKRDIVWLGTTEGGFHLYSYRYLWDDQVRTGVMAQEVIERRPDAVVIGDDGYYRVDYGKLGLAHLLH